MNDWSMLKKLIWLHIVKGGGGIERTVKGAIVHVINALARPAISVKCEVNPIQDLHGYDSPWPAGGGVSKCPSFANGTHTMMNGLTVTIQDGEITINGTASDSGYYEEAIESTVMPADAYVSFNNPVGTYNIAYVFINGNTQIASPSTAPANATKQPTGLSGATVNKLRIFCNAATYDNFKMSPIVHDGSTPQAWQPYSNICPISGRTSATVTRTGVNVWDEEWEVGSYNTTTGAKSTSSAGRIRCANFISVVQGIQYYVSAVVDGVLFYDQDKNYISYITVPTGRTFVIPNGILFITFFTKTNYGATYNNDISINYPSTDHDYHPHQGNTYTIQLGDTVYGGTLDVTGGKMVVDRAMIDMGTLNWQYNTTYAFFTSSSLTARKVGVENIVSDLFKTEAGSWSGTPKANALWGNGSNATIYVQYPLTEVSELLTLISGHQLLYELATPFEITLTPTQIETLIGQNNVWSDAGDLTLTYYADGNASTSEALGILLGGTYNNPGGADDVSDDEALGILLGGS